MKTKDSLIALTTLEPVFTMYNWFMVLIQRPVGLFSNALVAGPPFPELPEESWVPANVFMIAEVVTNRTLKLPESDT